MKKMKEETIRKHVSSAYYSYKLMRAYENMENPIAKELYKSEEKDIRKHLSAVGIKKNERDEAINVFEGWYKELTEEELKDIKADAESLLSSIEDMRRELPELLKKAEAEVEELRELSQTELYDAFAYSKNHEEERSALTFAASTFVTFELQCRVDEEELRAKLEKAYELGFEGRDEDPYVICFLWDEIDSGRTDEALRIIEENKAEEAKEEEESRKMKAEEYALNRTEELEELQTVVAEEQRTEEAQEAAEEEAAEEEAAEQAAAEYNKYTDDIIKEAKEKDMEKVIEQIKDVNIGYYIEDAFDELLNIAQEHDLYVERFDDFVDDDTVLEIIKAELSSNSWDLISLVCFMEGVNFRRDDLYILEYGELKNVKDEDLEELKELMVEAAKNKLNK